MTAQQNKKTIESLYEALADQNIDFGEHAAKFVTDDCAWAASRIPTRAVEAGVGFVQPCTGPDGVRQYFKHWKDQVEVQRFDVDKIVADDDTVVAWTHQKLKYNATGKEVEDYVLHEFVMRDGKIAEHYHYCDTAKHIEASSK